MKYVYKTQGTCSTNIELEVENNISRLVTGMPVSDVITKLEGIRCGARSTSCPDQLCRALHEMGF